MGKLNKSSSVSRNTQAPGRMMALLKKKPVRELISIEKFLMLPSESQQRLFKLLPSNDVHIAENNKADDDVDPSTCRISHQLSFAVDSALSHEIFNTACGELMERIDRDGHSTTLEQMMANWQKEPSLKETTDIMMEAGELVWAKFPNCRWWPAVIMGVRANAVSDRNDLFYQCGLFDRPERGWLPPSKICAFGNGRKTLEILRDKMLLDCTTTEQAAQLKDDFSEPLAEDFLSSRNAHWSANNCLQLPQASEIKDVSRDNDTKTRKIIKQPHVAGTRSDAGNCVSLPIPDAAEAMSKDSFDLMLASLRESFAEEVMTQHGMFGYIALAIPNKLRKFCDNSSMIWIHNDKEYCNQAIAQYKLTTTKASPSCSDNP